MNRNLLIFFVVVAVFGLGYVAYENNTFNKETKTELHTDEMEISEEGAMEEDVTVTETPTQQTAPTSGAQTPPPAPAPKPASSTPKNSVVIGETKTGNGIQVESVTLDTIGYVVIYRVNSQGESSMIGRTEALSVGTHRDITVRFSTVIAYEQTIVAVLHEDDGDIVFEFPESDPYLTTPEGTIIADIDVVDVDDTTEEAQAMERQVKAFLESNFQPTVD